MVSRTNFFYLSIVSVMVSVFVFISFALATNTLSEDIFPDSLSGIPLTSTEEETPDDEIREGFAAYYETEDKDISIFFWRGRSQKIVESAKRDFVSEISAQFGSLFDRIDWSDPENVSIKIYDAQILTYKAYLGDDYIDGAIIYLVAKDYFILVQIIDFTGKPLSAELTSIAEMLVGKIPDDGGGNGDQNWEETLPDNRDGGESGMYISEKMQEIKDSEITEKIYEDQTSYKKEYVEAYEMIEGGIGQITIKDAKLNIRLEVQGSTAGRIPKVNEGDEIEVRLEITNNSKYALALTAGIFYPEVFNVEEKKYTISFDWDGGLSSFIGSFKTKLINANFIIMPSGSKIIVYSKVVPKQTGYLDVQGLVFFTTEKKYQKHDIGLLDETPKNYQESGISETILVEESSCDWWPICL